MSTRDDETSQVPDQLMEQLLKGYDSLQLEFKLLNDQRRELDRKLAWAKQQYTDVLKRYAPETEPTESQTFLEELEEATACARNGNVDWLDHISKDADADRRTRAFNIRVANDAREKLRHRQSEQSGVKIWKDRPALKRGSVSRGSVTSKLKHELEQDFTVPGTPSKLGCPFAVPAGDYVSLGQRGLPTPRSSAPSRASGSISAKRRSSLVDPIRVEICGNNPASPAVSDQGSSALCPIRFMDQHSPEEVAQYFEKHKHQIPRSHEVCIKRYQSNSDSIRELDAKYGSLVSMIQGLGQKHQPILAEKDPEIEDVEDREKNDSVGKWANNVATSLSGQEVKAEPELGAEERQPHFDRPLKEIRVGESPSRPWGITVPTKYAAAANATSETSAFTASPQELSSPRENKTGEDTSHQDAPARKCPFDHTKMAGHLPKAASQSHHQHPPPVFVAGPADAGVAAAQTEISTPRMQFTGPVFIGYPIEQAVQFLKETGYGLPK